MSIGVHVIGPGHGESIIIELPDHHRRYPLHSVEKSFASRGRNQPTSWAQEPGLLHEPFRCDLLGQSPMHDRPRGVLSPLDAGPLLPEITKDPTLINFLAPEFGGPDSLPAHDATLPQEWRRLCLEDRELLHSCTRS